MMYLSDLTIYNWRQFRNLNMHFDERITFITGINGTGKTSICKIISSFISDSVPFVRDDNFKQHNIIGQIRFGDASYPIMTAGLYNTDLYTFHFPEFSKPTVLGAYIRSNRQEFSYSPINNIKAGDIVESLMVKSLSLVTYSKLDDTRKIQEVDPFSNMKNTLISWAVFGYGNRAVEPIPAYLEYFQRFSNVIKSVLPSELGVRDLVVSGSDLILKTRSGNVKLDEVSSGLSTIIELCWKCLIAHIISQSNPLDYRPLIIIDEPENHLHPSLQKMILPKLLENFNDCQFIISTHNPLIISSVRESTIFALTYEGDGVISREISGLDRSSEAETILREALGLESSMPTWAEEVYKSIIDKHRYIQFNEQLMSSLEADLEEAGLGEYSLTALNEILRLKREAN